MTSSAARFAVLAFLLLAPIPLSANLPVDEETRIDVEVKTSPLLRMLLNRSSPGRTSPFDGLSRAHERAGAWVEAHRTQIAAWSWRLPAGLLAAGFLCLMAGLRSLSRSCVTVCYGLAQKWLLLFSVGSVVLFAVTGVNLWQAGPAQLWSAPVLAMGASVALMYIIDVNYPVWNSTMSGLLPPAASSAALMIWGQTIR